MDISSISSQLMTDYQTQLDLMDQELQQTISTQQDATSANTTVQAGQLDAFATSTIQQSQQS
ncbi:MAG TPA: hypothetical protein VIJ14_09825 [Rhabdochlamydiaceae bacterium]